MKNEGLPIIISAPSGTGKTTTCKVLIKRLPNLKIATSHTTRKIREGEVEGVDYFFVSKETFETKKHNNEFLEWAQVHTEFYGTSLESIAKHQQKGFDILLELDVQGVASLRKMDFKGVFILILPPSIEEMANRLRKRGTEPEESIQRRLKTGKQEIKSYQTYDYVITNNEVEETVESILAIVRAEKSRVSRYIPTSDDIKELLG
ncbi:MAG: guanylate kinase [Nitrospina sp.]|jgi:guanylate kinase|nr:guanylate kinase [Nitrospina sp.]MBT6716143.1 guanylate kinase [Nitrospina sp.]